MHKKKFRTFLPGTNTPKNNYPKNNLRVRVRSPDESHYRASCQKDGTRYPWLLQNTFCRCQNFVMIFLNLFVPAQLAYCQVMLRIFCRCLLRMRQRRYR